MRKPVVSRLVLVIICLAVSACSITGKKDGKYYQDDGPPRFKNGPRPSSVPNAIPINEVLSRTGNKPYTALGKRYVPLKSGRGYKKTGNASWYGRKYHGRTTSSGEVYDMYKMTAAHPVLPLPSYVLVRNLSNQREVIVKVNDRGPFLGDRVIDLSYMAAKKLGVVATGTASVFVKTVFADSDSTPKLKSDVGKPSSKPLTSSLNETVLLQAGSFASAENAWKLYEQLVSKGYRNTKVEQVRVSERIYYRVQIGPYDNRQAVEATAVAVEEFLRSPVSILKN
jgi:rare lipoprotein A